MAAFAAAALIGVIVGASIVKVPYFALRPGSVLDSRSAIEVEGAQTYDSSGALHYTTVSIRQTTALEWMMASFDDDVELVHEEELLGDRDAEENRQYNQVLMDQSQLVAPTVALETLGYEVDSSIGGMAVGEVDEELPARGVLEVGDVIVEVDGEALDDIDSLELVMSEQEPGGEIDLKIIPCGLVTPCGIDGEHPEEAPAPDEVPDEALEELTVDLVEDPQNEGRAIMGVVVGAYDLEYDFPVDIRFDTGEIGGPSAGLAFTLTLIDLMSPGDLTGGLDVAITGRVSPDGTVGSVGGTGQKAAAARSDDMDVFLVPAEGSDYENADAHSGDVEVIPVGSVEEALETLESLGGDPLEIPAEVAG